MEPGGILVWGAFGYVLLQAVRYLLGARIYLTCALREVEAAPTEGRQIDAGELRLLGLLDRELAAAGFRHLGFGRITALLTYYGTPLTVSVFANERIPAYALVRRRLAPELGALLELELRTVLASGEEIVTVNTPTSEAFLPEGLRVEAHPMLSVAGLVERHVARVATGESGRPAAVHGDLQGALDLIAAGLAKLRAQFRKRGWAVASADHRFDRFTVRGAFALTHYSRRVFGARRARAGVPTLAASSAQMPAPGLPVRLAGTSTPAGMSVPVSASAPAGVSASSTVSSVIAPTSAPEPMWAAALPNEYALRVEADLQAILHVADNPEAPPGTPWPLLTVMVATALLSFVAMALLWNVYVAVLILAAITFHEAGHALAMRWLGYRDVHVFFLPLLGAMTVGQPVATTVRNRLAVLFAGPVPGLWLAVILLALDQAYGPVELLHMGALGLLILNGLNLLPFTPLDGGRALEALGRPEGLWRLMVHGASVLGLLALAAALKDPLLAALGLVWAALLPRQVLGYRLRGAIAAAVQDRGDFRGVVRTALEVMTTPRYTKWRAATRQVTARAMGRLFAESIATPGDRRWGALAYVSAWIPLAVAFMLWTS